MSSLSGRRVVVTRAAAQAQPLVDRLVELGAEPLVVPLIDIVDPSDRGAALHDALARLDEFDWVVVTSPNGAARVRDALNAAAPRPSVAAVGAATAGILGGRVDLVPRVQTGEGLAAEFGAGHGQVLLIQPERGDPEQTQTEPFPSALRMSGTWITPIHRALVAQGWTVTAVDAYRTAAVVPSSGDLLRVMSADAALFASGSAVRAWVDVFGAVTPPVTVAIGPSTAQVAAEIGLKIDVVATDHSLHGLVDSLVAYFDEAV